MWAGKHTNARTLLPTMRIINKQVIAMNKRVTFFIASDSGGIFKKLSLSRGGLLLAGATATIVLLLTGYILTDYLILRHQTATVSHLTNEITHQKEQINGQQQQIRQFAEQINGLKSDLVALNDFEEKIRIIANIEKAAGEAAAGPEAGLLGMGGSIPEDVNPVLSPGSTPNSLLRELHGQLNTLDTALLEQKQNFASLLNYLEDKRRLLASTPAIRPLNGGWVTSRFAYRKSPFTGRREFHHGLDVAAREGTPLVATADGKIIYSGRKGALGNCIIIDHGHGMITRYGHLEKCLKKRGDTVEREDIVGTVGNTGMSTGPHVHYEVRINGIPVNPEKYILN